MNARVLIVDKRAVIATDVCRALAAQGCAAEVFASRASPAFRSRFCSAALISPPFEDRAAFFEALNAVVHGGEPYDAIHVCHEEILSSIGSMLDTPHWRGLLTPPPAALQTTLSKNAMVALAAEAGVATPRTAVPACEDEMIAAVKDFQFPIVIKGDTGEAGETVRIVWKRRDVLRAYRAVRALETRADSRPAIQEFIRGDAYSVGGLYHRGKPLRVVAHRKLVRYPHPYGGKTVKGVTEYSPELLREAFKIFAALEYSGLGHVEFVRDNRDGVMKFLEINPRLWGTIGVAEDAGVDLFTPYRRLVAGERVAPDLLFRLGVMFHRLRREIVLISSRRQRMFGFAKDALDPRVRSDFRWSDPGPHLPFVPWSRRPARPRTPPVRRTPRLAT